MMSPGRCPGAVEGSAFDPDAVVAGRVDCGDHTAPGEQPGELTPYELTGAQCVELAALLGEAASAVGPGRRCPCLLTGDLLRWADTLTLIEVVE